MKLADANLVARAKAEIHRRQSMRELRSLTVAHQALGECNYCDQRFDQIMDAAERGVDQYRSE